jgi:hypothetical protein
LSSGETKVQNVIAEVLAETEAVVGVKSGLEGTKRKAVHDEFECITASSKEAVSSLNLGQIEQERLPTKIARDTSSPKDDFFEVGFSPTMEDEVVVEHKVGVLASVFGREWENKLPYYKKDSHDDTTEKEKEESFKELLQRMQEANCIIPVNFDSKNIPTPNFESIKSTNSMYFLHNLVGRGATFLVSKSSLGYYNPQQLMDHREVELQLYLAKFSVNLSRDQREMLGHMLGLIVECTRRRTKPIKEVDRQYIFPHIPLTPEDIRRQYIKGKHALLPNLPMPTKYSLKQHAGVTFASIVDDVLANQKCSNGISQ